MTALYRAGAGSDAAQQHGEISMTDDGERIEAVVMGRRLGTASGWDLVDDFVVGFYDFCFDENDLHFPLVEVNFNNGTILFYEEKGSESPSDIVEDAASYLMLFPRDVSDDAPNPPPHQGE